MNIKLKRVAVLGGILLTGVFFIGKFPAAGQGPNSVPNYGSLRQACLNDTLTVGGCLVAAAALNQVRAGSTDIQPVLAALRNALNLTGKTTCDSCVTTTANFESLLATNGTAQEIEQTLHAACARDFPDFTSQQACDGFVDGNVPQIIDHLLANYPPVTLCQNFGFCPVN
jgi:hypothetical protein